MEVTGERYIPDQMQGDITIEHMHRYNAIKDMVRNKVVLDAACGSGYGSNIIANDAKQVFGIDISMEAIDYANDNYIKDNIKFLNMGIESLNFPDETFDVIVSFETIEHVNETIQDNFMQEIKRVLKKDGLLIISTPNKYNYSDIRNYKNEYHIKEFYENEFIDMISQKFKNLEIYYQYFNSSSYIISYSKSDLRQINFDENNKGLYFIVVASNNDIEKSSGINSVYYYPTNKNIDILKYVEDYEAVIKQKDEEFKKSVQTYEAVIKQKDEEFKKSVQTYETVIKQKDEEFKKSVQTYGTVIKQKDEEFKKSVQTYETVIKQKDEEFKKSVQIYEDVIKQKDEEFKKSVQTYEDVIKQKDEEFKKKCTNI